MVNELRIPHVVVSLVYMIVQIVIIIGYLYCRGYGDNMLACNQTIFDMMYRKK